MEQYTIYLRMRNRLKVRLKDTITVEDIAQLVGDKKIIEEIRHQPLYEVTVSDKSIIIIDVMKVVGKINEVKHLDIQTIGPAQTIVEVMYEKKKIAPVYFVLVWLLLFFGASLAIMNFHEDVSMREVHQRIYKIITGESNEYPILLQIPYSLGLGIGMILFFNHLFRKRINEEPSPLEVEMHNYQLDLDQYVIVHENKESVKKLDDSD
jgi:stage V sporulation protein AA